VPTVVVRTGLLPQQVEDFPEDCERSCKGALHLKPGTTLMTDGELAHIRKSRPELNAYLQIVNRTRPTKPPAVPDVPPDEEKGDPAVTETVTEIPGPAKAEESGTKKRKKSRFLPDAH